MAAEYWIQRAMQAVYTLFWRRAKDPGVLPMACLRPNGAMSTARPSALVGIQITVARTDDLRVEPSLTAGTPRTEVPGL